MKIRKFKPIEMFCSILIVVMTLTIIYRVFMRFVFNSTPSWSEELTAMLMVYITLLSIPLGIKHDAHLSLTMFFAKLPDGLQRFLTYLNYLIMLVFAGFVMVFNGYLMVKMTSSSSLSSLPLKNSTLYIMMPIAGILSVVFLLQHIIRDIRAAKHEKSKGVKLHGTD